MFFSQLYLGQVLELKNEANANLPKIAVATWGWLQEQINPHRILFKNIKLQSTLLYYWILLIP